MYNPALVSLSQLPSTILELAQPAWKGKVAISPTDSDFAPQVGAVIATDGTQGALQWLRGLKTNAALYQDEEATVAAVNRGQVAVGLINQYYWYRLQLEVGAQNVHSQLYFFPNQDVGGVENISGVAVLASSHQKANATRFVLPGVGEGAAASGLRRRLRVPGPRPGSPPTTSCRRSRVDPAVLSVTSLGNDQAAASLIQQAGLT